MTDPSGDNTSSIQQSAEGRKRALSDPDSPNDPSSPGLSKVQRVGTHIFKEAPIRLTTGKENVSPKQTHSFVSPSQQLQLSGLQNKFSQPGINLASGEKKNFKTGGSNSSPSLLIAALSALPSGARKGHTNPSEDCDVLQELELNPRHLGSLISQKISPKATEEHYDFLQQLPVSSQPKTANSPHKEAICHTANKDQPLTEKPSKVVDAAQGVQVSQSSQGKFGDSSRVKGPSQNTSTQNSADKQLELLDTYNTASQAERDCQLEDLEEWGLLDDLDTDADASKAQELDKVEPQGNTSQFDSIDDELLEFIEEQCKPTADPVSQVEKQRLEIDEELEAELDAFLEDEDLQPPSDDDNDTYETTEQQNVQSPARVPTDPDAIQIDSPSPKLKQKGPAMHSWLIRSPEPSAPQQWTIRHVEREPVSDEPLSEITDMKRRPGRVISLPRRCEDDVNGFIMPVTSTEGDQVYCTLIEETRRTSKANRHAYRSRKLLSAEINILMDQIDQEAYLRAVAESSTAPDREKVLPDSSVASTPPKAELWVDKYSPQNFLELLSDELINREVLRWLKSWDSIIFAAAKKPHKSVQGGRLKPLHKGLPEQKILLMSGPPGLGKTTLAHVVARHCGFRPVEINASDDRTGNALQTRIVDATHMQPVIGAKLPNCVIIDEIDGAAGGSEGKSAITALLKLIQGQPGQASNERQDNEEDGKTKKKKGAQPLNRPLIAICNDLYAPVLRPLRNVAKIVSFKSPEAAKLVARLQMICAKEGVQIDRQALTLLAEKTENDVRACLNTLQFLAKEGAKIQVADVSRLSLGQKDMTKDIFSLWNDLLCDKKAGRKKSTEDTENLYRSLGDFGDHELVLSGVHQNMLTRSFLDTRMALTCKVFDQIYAADSLMTAVRHNMDFSLQSYLPAAILGIRAVVASPDRSRLQWPKAAMDHSRMLVSNKALLQHWMLGVSHHVYSSLQSSFLTQECIPCLVKIVQQPIRAVAKSLLSDIEKRCLSSVVSILIGYGLDLDISCEEDSSGLAPLGLRPEIQTLCSFESFPVRQGGLSVAVKQLIASEVQHERLKLKSQRLGSPSSSPKGLSQKKDNGATSQKQIERPQSAGTKLMLSVAERAQQAGKETLGKKSVRKSNWLEQMREKKQQRRSSVMAQNNPTSGQEGNAQFSTLYKFKEGYTNAVKRPLYMKDLL